MRRDTRHGRASESRRKFETVVTTNLRTRTRVRGSCTATRPVSVDTRSEQN